MIGTVAGSYRIVSKISEGGMGVVYRAEHTMIGRPVAVKVLLPELSNQHDTVTRFFNEARAATAVRHPGIVEIFDFGYMPSGQAYIVMELLEGESVARRLRRIGRFPERDAMAIIRGTAAALDAAHQSGIIHRDLKPDNLFMCPDPGTGGERPKLLDFGIAKLTRAPQQGPSLTRVGAVLGTPTYMSPEQCRGAGEVDHRADLYSLGCIFFELVTGRPPFTSQAFGELIANHLMETPEAPRTLVPTLSETCDAIIMRLLAKKPEERHASAEELGADLDRLLGPLSSPAWMPPAPGAFGHAPTTVSTAAPWATPPPMPATETASPTTLGRSSAVIDTVGAPDRNRRGLAIGLGAIAGVTAVVVIALVMSPGGKAKPAGPEPLPAMQLDAAVGEPALAIDASVAPTLAMDAAVAPALAMDAAVAPTPAVAVDAAAAVDAAVTEPAPVTPKPTTAPSTAPKPSRPRTRKPPEPPADPFAPRPRTTTTRPRLDLEAPPKPTRSGTPTGKP